MFFILKFYLERGRELYTERMVLLKY